MISILSLQELGGTFKQLSDKKHVGEVHVTLSSRIVKIDTLIAVTLMTILGPIGWTQQMSQIYVFQVQLQTFISTVYMQLQWTQIL